MKQMFTIIFFCMAIIAKGQNGEVEKSVYGIQTGFLGIWGYNESRLSKSLALRSEIGFDTGFWGSNNSETGFIMKPVITIEPRFYYNLDKRVSQSRNIINNSGNFLSLKTSFRPDWFAISNKEGMKMASDISVVPTWGIRRQIGEHFNFETAFGLGYRYVFANEKENITGKGSLAVNLQLRVGYTF